MQIGILESEDFSLKAIKKLNSVGCVSFYDEKECLEEFIAKKDVLFIRLKYYIGKELLKNAKNLKYICSPTTGYNHLDINYLENNNITFLSLKGEFEFLSKIRATPEHTFGLVLSLLRNYKVAYSLDKDFFQRDELKGHELYKNKVGIIGFGRVGKLLAKYFNAFDADVSFFDTDLSIDTDAIRFNSIDKLIKNNNIIILCASYSLKNENMISKKYIDLLYNKYFINTARGELVDENYLIEKIKSNFFNGVALDVLKNETGQNNLKKLQLLSKKNVIVTPHIAGATYDSMYATEEFITKKLGNILG